MKLPMILVLVLGNAIALAAQDTANNMRQKPSPIEEKTKRLELSITTDRQKYKRDGKITITAVITNGEYIKDLIVFGRLGWGYYASLSLFVSDASGKPVLPKIIPDELTPPISRDDVTSFVKLPPRHFLGVNFREDLNMLSLRTPGKYSMFVKYHCPISISDVELRDFWSKEDGTLTSNVVTIQILP